MLPVSLNTLTQCLTVCIELQLNSKFGNLFSYSSKKCLRGDSYWTSILFPLQKCMLFTNDLSSVEDTTTTKQQPRSSSNPNIFWKQNNMLIQAKKCAVKRRNLFGNGINCGSVHRHWSKTFRAAAQLIYLFRRIMLHSERFFLFYLNDSSFYTLLSKLLWGYQL